MKPIYCISREVLTIFDSNLERTMACSSILFNTICRRIYLIIDRRTVDYYSSILKNFN